MSLSPVVPAALLVATLHGFFAQLALFLLAQVVLGGFFADVLVKGICAFGRARFVCGLLLEGGHEAGANVVKEAIDDGCGHVTAGNALVWATFVKGGVGVAWVVCREESGKPGEAAVI